MHNYYLQIVALITLMFLVVQLLMQIWFSKVNSIVITHRQSSQNIFKKSLFFLFASKELILKVILYYKTGDEVDFG